VEAYPHLNAPYGNFSLREGNKSYTINYGGINKIKRVREELLLEFP